MRIIFIDFNLTEKPRLPSDNNDKIDLMVLLLLLLRTIDFTIAIENEKKKSCPQQLLQVKRLIFTYLFFS